MAGASQSNPMFDAVFGASTQAPAPMAQSPAAGGVAPGPHATVAPAAQAAPVAAPVAAATPGGEGDMFDAVFGSGAEPTSEQILPTGTTGAVVGGGTAASIASKLPIPPLAKAGVTVAGAVFGGGTEMLVDEFMSDEFQEGTDRKLKELNVGVGAGVTGHAGGMIGLNLAQKLPIPVSNRVGAVAKVITMVGGYLGGFVYGSDAAMDAMNAISGSRIGQVVFGSDVKDRERTPGEESMRMLGYGAGGGAAMVKQASWKYIMSTGSEILAAENVGGPITELWLSMARNPATALKMEIGSAFGMSQGTYWAETIYPGNHYVRSLLEFTGGFANPAALGAKLMSAAPNRLAGMFGEFTNSEQRAAKFVLQQLAKAGADVDDVITALRAQPIEGFTAELSSAEKTGIPILAQIEKALSKAHPEMYGEAAFRTNNAYEAMKMLIKAKTVTGAYKTLQERADDEMAAINILLDSEIQTELAAIDARVAAMADDATGDWYAIGEEFRVAIQGTLDRARNMENIVWKAVGEDETPLTNLDNFADRFAEFKRENLEIDVANFPGIGAIREVVRKMQMDADPRVAGLAEGIEDPALAAWALKMFTDAEAFTGSGMNAEGPTVQLAILLRSSLLSKARTAAAGGDSNGARQLYSLAEAVRHDIDTTMEGSANAAYFSAAAFSKALNDTYTRNNTLAKSTGAIEMPETLLRKTFTGHPEAVEAKYLDIEAITKFMDTPAFAKEDTAPLTSAILENQVRFMKLTTQQVLNVKTGEGKLTFNKAAAERLLERWKTVFDRYPEIRDELTGAIASADKAKLFVKNRSEDKIAINKSALSRVMGTSTERPEREIVAMLTSGATPIRDYTSLIKLVKGDKAASEGLVEATINGAIEHATRADGGFDFNKLAKLLGEPTTQEGVSVLDLLRKNNIVDEGFVSRMHDIIATIGKMDLAKYHKAAPAKPGTDHPGVDMPSTALLERAMARAVGSSAAVRAANALGAGHKNNSLILAYTGARVAEDKLVKAGLTFMGITLKRMADDPEYMALLLEQVSSPAKVLQFTKRAHAYAAAIAGNMVAEILNEDDPSANPRP